jgi:hypothetical protein
MTLFSRRHPNLVRCTFDLQPEASRPNDRYQTYDRNFRSVVGGFLRSTADQDGAFDEEIVFLVFLVAFARYSQRRPFFTGFPIVCRRAVLALA